MTSRHIHISIYDSWTKPRAPDRATSPANPIAIGSDQDTIRTVRSGSLAVSHPLSRQGSGILANPLAARTSLLLPLPASASPPQALRSRPSQSGRAGDSPADSETPAQKGCRRGELGRSGPGHPGAGRGLQQPPRPRHGRRCERGLDPTRLSLATPTQTGCERGEPGHSSASSAPAATASLRPGAAGGAGIGSTSTRLSQLPCSIRLPCRRPDPDSLANLRSPTSVKPMGGEHQMPLPLRVYLDAAPPFHADSPNA